MHSFHSIFRLDQLDQLRMHVQTAIAAQQQQQQQQQQPHRERQGNEAEAAEGNMSWLQSTPFILMGDFNALREADYSPAQWMWLTGKRMTFGIRSDTALTQTIEAAVGEQVKQKLLLNLEWNGSGWVETNLVHDDSNHEENLHLVAVAEYTDRELQDGFVKHGEQCPPITSSTRGTIVKKLVRLEMNLEAAAAFRI